MGGALRHAMQVDARIRLQQAAPHPVLGGAIDAAGAGDGFLFCGGFGWGGPDRAAFLEGLFKQLALFVGGKAAAHNG